MREAEGRGDPSGQRMNLARAACQQISRNYGSIVGARSSADNLPMLRFHATPTDSLCAGRTRSEDIAVEGK